MLMEVTVSSEFHGLFRPVTGYGYPYHLTVEPLRREYKKFNKLKVLPRGTTSPCSYATKPSKLRNIHIFSKYTDQEGTTIITDCCP